MTKGLIQKSSRAFLIYALLLLLIAAPIFYLVTEHLYLEDADEALVLRKSEYFKYYDAKIHKDEIDLWNRLNRDNKISHWTGQISDTLFNTSYFDTLNNELEPYRELNFPIVIDGENFLYSTRLNLIESEDLIESVVWLFSIIVVLLLIGIFLISRKLAVTLWKPFYMTLSQVEVFDLDSPNIPDFHESKTTEFVRLNEAFGKLIQRNVDTFKRQKEFLENAAHELQTPLAVLQSKIDGQLQNANLTIEQATFLEDLNSSISKLNRINKNLLLLSRIDQNIKENISSVDLSGLIEQNLSFFTEQAKQKDVKVTYRVNNEVVVEANPYLVECMVNNLLMNAIKHNKEGGIVNVILIHHTLVVSNSSNDNELDRQKLFMRFSKQGQDFSGTGLGLPIVKRITEVFGWSITYDYSNECHFFSVDF